MIEAVTVLAISVFIFSAFFIYFFLATCERKQSKLRAYYHQSVLGSLLEFTNAIFSLASCVNFIVGTYQTSNVDMETPVLLIMEIVFTSFFIVNYFFQLYISCNRLLYVVSLMALVDKLTCIPVIVTIFVPSNISSDMQFLRVYRVLKIVRVVRLGRLIRTMNYVASPITDAVRSHITRFIGRAVCLLLIVSGAVQVFSSLNSDEWGDNVPDSGMSFHDAVYFTIITISTVGYGDIAPETWPGRLLTVLVVVIVIIFVPTETQHISRLMSLRPKFGGSIPLHVANDHVIICCDDTCMKIIEAFLQEFFHPDHGLHTTHVVLLVPTDPDMAWKSLILQYVTKDRLTYLKGDLRSVKDIKRAQADRASAIFILTDRHDKDTESQEMRTFLRALMCHECSPDVKTFVQVVKNESIDRFRGAGVSPEHLLCLEAIRKRMLAGACLWQGLPTLLSNLISSCTLTSLDEMEEWEKNYAIGLGKEIYSVDLMPFAGSELTEVTISLYHEFGCILFAVSRHNGQIFLFPGKQFVLEENDEGFIIADDFSVAAEIARYGSSFRKTHRSTSRSKEKRKSQRSSDGDSDGGTKGLRDFFQDASFRDLFQDAELSFHQFGRKPQHLDSRVEDERELGNELLSRCNGNNPNLDMRNKDGAVVVISKTLDHVDSLFEYLFSAHIDHIWPGKEIILLCPSLENVEKEEICKIVHKGKKQITLISLPPKAECLKYAEVHKAQMILLLSSRMENNDTPNSEDIDAETITTYVEVRALAKDARVIVELHDTKYMDHISILSQSKPFATGQGNELLQRDYQSSSLMLKKRVPDNLMFNDAYMCGDVVLGNFSELLLCQAYFNPHIIEVIYSLLSSTDEPKDGKTVFLAQISLPLSLFKKIGKGGDDHPRRSRRPTSLNLDQNPEPLLFGHVFEYLLRHYDAVPLGIFRPADAELHSPGHVVTCPDKDFEVTAADKIFILAKVNVFQKDAEPDPTKDTTPDGDFFFDFDPPKIYGKQHMINSRGRKRVVFYTPTPSDRSISNSLSLPPHMHDITDNHVSIPLQQISRQMADLNEKMIVLQQSVEKNIQKIHQRIDQLEQAQIPSAKPIMPSRKPKPRNRCT